jgi:uncharacterized protein YdeI (YjbR/CyaY-like superfamily)
MRPEDCTYFESRDAFRAWLNGHHDSADVLQVGFYKKGSGRASVTYPEAVDEALCFGWIDGVRHAVDADSFTVRFTPRRAGSKWSAINIKRAEGLIEAGLMHEAGLCVFKERRDAPAGYSHETAPVELPELYLARLKASEHAWAFFSSQTPWYRRTAAFWVMAAKREETRERRLEALIADSEAGQHIRPLTRPNQR